MSQLVFGINIGRHYFVNSSPMKIKLAVHEKLGQYYQSPDPKFTVVHEKY